MSRYPLKYFFIIGLLIYVAVLIYILFISVGSTNRSTYYDNPDDHMLPFHSTYKMLKNAVTYHQTPHGAEFKQIFLTNILGNLVLLFPWGFLGPLVFRQLNHVKKVGITALFISFMAEVTQFYSGRGVFDIDDLIYNSLGAIGGFYLLLYTIQLFSFSKLIKE